MFISEDNNIIETTVTNFVGKSYTVTGTPSEPGLLPRALDGIFNSLDLQQQLSEHRVYPERFSELAYLTSPGMEREKQWKEHALDMVRLLGNLF